MRRSRALLPLAIGSALVVAASTCIFPEATEIGTGAGGAGGAATSSSTASSTSSGGGGVVTSSSSTTSASTTSGTSSASSTSSSSTTSSASSASSTTSASSTGSSSSSSGSTCTFDAGTTSGTPSPGDTLWVRTLGGMGQDVGSGVAVTPAPELAAVVTGTLGAPGDLGCGVVSGIGVFAAKIDGVGQFVWGNALGSSAQQMAGGVAVRSAGANAGRVELCGGFSGTISLGGTMLQAGSSAPQIFAAALDPAGAPKWGDLFGTPNSTSVANAMALDDFNSLVIVGKASGNPLMLQSPALGADAFVLRLDLNAGAGDAGGGTVGYFGDTDDQEANAVAIDTGQNLLVTGSYHGVISFGAGAATAATGARDVFVAKLLPSKYGGIWQKYFGGAAPAVDRGLGIAVDRAGNDAVVVVGDFQGDLDFGKGPLQVASALTGGFIVRLDKFGVTQWSLGVTVAPGGDAGGQGDASVAAVAIDAGGRILVTGSFTGDVLVGSTVLHSHGLLDAFVAALDAGGNVLWARALGGPMDDAGTAVAIDANGDAFVTGYHSGNADFGLMPALMTSGSQDAFLLKLSH